MLPPACHATAVEIPARIRFGARPGTPPCAGAAPSDRVRRRPPGRSPDDRVGVVLVGHFEYRTLGPGTERAVFAVPAWPAEFPLASANVGFDADVAA